MLTQSLCNFERSDYSVPSKTKDAQEKTYNQEQKQNKLKASSLSRIPTTSTTRGRRNGDDNNYEDDAEPEQPGSDLDSVLEALGRCSTTSLCRKPKNAMNEKMRDIERNNATLLRRIIANNHRTNQFMPNARPGPVNVSHASVNRKKRQTQIDRDNLKHRYRNFPDNLSKYVLMAGKASTTHLVTSQSSYSKQETKPYFDYNYISDLLDIVEENSNG